MSNRFEQWAALSGSVRSPEPGDLVSVFPVGDMTGYVLPGAVYVGVRPVHHPDLDLTPLSGVAERTVHEVLYEGNILVISGHSHEIQVLDSPGDD